jgi:TonB-dependent receptor
MQQKLRTLLNTGCMLSRYALYGMVLQCVLLNLMFAETGSAQNIYQVQVTVEKGSTSLKDLFRTIEEKTEFSFIYSPARINASERIIIDGEFNSLGTLLDFIGVASNLSFKQVNANILIKAINKIGGKGTLRGQVVDSQTNEVLPGATILLKGTTIGTTSDVNGGFLLRVPSGENEIEVSYIGYKNHSQTVTVTESGTASVDFKMESDALQLKDIIITGVLQGQQRALNQQKTADNVKNIISADQIGRFPDPNVAEALQRVPAVNIERDQGEGRYVLVRGLAPQFTNISINGEQIPSPEAGVRYVALDAVPADQLASIEVSKALTPDMDGDAIGGNVNLITRTAQSETPAISASALAGYNHLVGRTNLQGSLELSKRFLNNRLGLMLNSSYYETDRGSDNWERDDNALELRDYELLRTRLGLSSTIDYRLNDNHELYFRTIYNRFTDREVRRRFIFSPNTANSPFEEHTIERFTKDRLEKQIVTSLNLGAKHAFAGFNLDYEIAYAEAIQDTPFDIEIGSAAEVDELSIDFDSNAKFPSFSVNDIPHTSKSNPYLNNSLYAFDELTVGNTYALDVNKTAKFNLSIPLSAGKNNGLLKFGSKIRMKEKSFDVTENVFSWEGGDVTFPGIETGDYTLEKFSGGTVDNNFLGNRYFLSASADDNKVIRHFNENPAGYELSAEDKIAAEAVEAFEATEDVYAGYLMTRWQLNKLMVLGGLRYESTKVTYSSQEVIYDFQGDLQDIVPVTGSTDYSYFLPQLHLKYAANENTNLRFAATRSYARPNFQDIVPSQEIELNAREGMIGNPALKPVSATNIDLMAERYFGSVGVLSGGVFYKQLDDFIFNRRFETDNYPGAQGIELTLSQARNGEDASLLGFEIAYQQNLNFLPGLLKGFSIYSNYTFTSSNANIQSRNDIEQTEKIRLPGQAKHVGNFSLAYDLKRINIRLSSNFNGEYLSEVGGDASEDLFVKDRIQIDATATFTINARLRFFAEFLNITNQPFEVYQGSEDRYIQREFYSWWTRAGLKFDF